jgi:argininosuccinate lyase
MSRLWDKGGDLDGRILGYTAGDDHALDERLVAHDVRASIAHAEMLGAAGLLAPDTVADLSRELRRLAEEHARGEWSIALADEDCHTALEARLTERLGAVGGSIHLGRSRNDQVLAALRLYLKDALAGLANAVEGVAAALDKLAARQGDLAIPGYTHLQRAMPSSVALWAGGFAAELRDDATGLRAAMRRADKNPLGSAAGYGVPLLPIDRRATTEALGFSVTHEPVTAVQLSRGKAEAQALFEVALVAGDFARLASDLVLFATREFGFVRLPDSMTTGSSIMPQKKNPDVFELVRGHAATAQAALYEALAITAKLPSGYHRDLQLLKAPLFRSFDRALASAEILAATLPEIEFVAERVVLDADLFAAERAYRLVLDEGIPFREAYRRVAAELADGPTNSARPAQARPEQAD